MSSPLCPTAVAGECEPARCLPYCGPQVIDSLLAQPGAASGAEADLLLELRLQLARRSDGAHALHLFCELRLRMESRHYLAYFRLRRWLENHLVAAVQPCQAAAPDRVAVRLDNYCVEAIRRACLCASLRRGTPLLAPRLRFEFRPESPRGSEVQRDLQEQPAVGAARTGTFSEI